MWPAANGCLSSTSMTPSRDRVWRSSASNPGASALRCCTTTIGRAKVAGKPARTADRALSPPHDVPITTISYTLPHLPIDPIGRGKLFVARLELRHSEGLLRPERENPEMDERVVEEPMDSRLQRAVEVDEHVATQDDVELGEGPIGDEVVLREHDVALTSEQR